MTVDEARAEVGPALPGGAPPDRSTQTTWSPPWSAAPARSPSCPDRRNCQLILAHPFAAWRTFLHPSQREIAYQPSYAGPAQVTGGPGTGKTVTVLHRAAFLADRAREPTPGSACVTTFNGNLADALRAQLDLLIRDAAGAPEDRGAQRRPAGLRRRQAGPRHPGHRRRAGAAHPLGARPPRTPG